MVENQRIVDEIRSFLHAQDHTLTNQLPGLASAYVEACQVVNQRLRRCAEFLQQGLRSEAIHLAEAEPNLLEQVAVLDFPERSEWEDICLTYGLPPLPGLSITTAEALNEAYSALEPLQHLLRNHRLLALARAPSADRLALLRKIASLDSSNPIWEEDIRLFEKARFSQMEQEIRQAAARDDTAVLVAVLQEIEKTSWVEKPSPTLVKQAETSAGRSGRRRLRERLDELAGQLHDAFAALDGAQARKLRAQWLSAILEAELPVEHPLHERVSPALKWLAREDSREANQRKFQTALQELATALEDESITSDQLKRSYRYALAYNQELPWELESRYQDRLTCFRTARRRRQVTITSAGLAAGILMVALTTFWISKARQAARAADAIGVIEPLLEKKQFVEVRGFLEQLAANDPRVADRQEVVEWQRRLEMAEDEDQQRARFFQQALKDLEAAPLDGPEDRAARARQLARLPEEKAGLERVFNGRKELAWKAQQQRDMAFLPHFTDLRDKLVRLKRIAQDSPDAREIDTLLPEVQDQVTRLLAEASGVSPDKRQGAQELASQFQPVRELVESHRRETHLTNELTMKLSRGELDSFADALKTYKKEFPNSARGRDFNQALAERDLWAARTEWSGIIKPWENKPFEINSSDAKAQAEKCRRFLNTHAEFTEKDTVGEYLKNLEAIAQQNETEKDSAAAQLRRLFSNPSVKNVWFVKLDDGKTYYLKEDKQREIQRAQKSSDRKGSVNLSYLINFEMKQKNKPVAVEHVEDFGRAPQSAIAEVVDRIPANFANKTWDETMVELCERIRTAEQMDPILQLSLLKRSVECASKGSLPLAQALADHQKPIAKADLDLTVSWIDPNSEAATSVRPKAQEVINQLPSFREVLKKTADEKRLLQGRLSRSHLVICGWLERGKQGLQCRFDRALAGKQELCVVVPRSGQPPTLETIGEIDGGRATITTTQAYTQVEGRVVFARKMRKD